MSHVEEGAGGPVRRRGPGLLLGVLLGFNGPAMAASAVAFDIEGSQYGYVYNVGDEAEARARAIRRCSLRSESPCRVVLVCRSGGYGAISFYRLEGLDHAAWGAACGQESESEAHEQAIKACNRHGEGRCGRVDTAWFDEIDR